jgi:hypothetical protein
MYNELKDIFEYLISVRRLKTYISIDINLPSKWKIPKKFVDEDKIIENDAIDTENRFFSLISEFNEESLNVTVNNIKSIISYNKEIENKEKLLKQKIDELKRIFEQENLENLNSLKFEINEDKLDDGEEVINTGRASN